MNIKISKKKDEKFYRKIGKGSIQIFHKKENKNRKQTYKNICQLHSQFKISDDDESIFHFQWAKIKKSGNACIRYEETVTLIHCWQAY